MTRNTKSRTALRREKIARGEAKVKRYVDALGAAMDKYERENPHWHAQAILWLLESGFLSLRHYIESPKEKEITWGNPFVEFHYPVDWNWQAERGSEQPRVTYGKLSSSDTKAKTVKVMTRIMVETIIQTTLQTCTSRVALEKRGAGYRRLLPVEIIEKLQLIRSRKKRDLVLEELYRPFSIGVAGVDLDESQMKDGAKLSRKSQRELREVHKRIDLPAFTLNATVDGHPLDLMLILQAHPLVVDVGEKRAYYPITIGFHLAPKAEAGQDVLALMEQPWANPAQWSSEDDAGDPRMKAREAFHALLRIACLGSLRRLSCEPLLRGATTTPEQRRSRRAVSLFGDIRFSRAAKVIEARLGTTEGRAETHSIAKLKREI